MKGSARRSMMVYVYDLNDNRQLYHLDKITRITRVEQEESFQYVLESEFGEVFEIPMQGRKMMVYGF